MDRGKQSLETICLLLAYKIKYPENFFLLRGNHECASINRIYGYFTFDYLTLLWEIKCNNFISDFMMNVKDATISNYGKHSQIASIAYLWLLLVKNI